MTDLEQSIRTKIEYSLKADVNGDSPYSRTHKPIAFNDIQIGKVLLDEVTVTDITIDDNKQFEHIAVAGGTNNVAIKTGHGTLRYSLVLTFSNTNDINTKFREILGYYKMGPFITLRSPYIYAASLVQATPELREVLGNSGVVEEDSLESLKNVDDSMREYINVLKPKIILAINHKYHDYNRHPPKDYESTIDAITSRVVNNYMLEILRSTDTVEDTKLVETRIIRELVASFGEKFLVYLPNNEAAQAAFVDSVINYREKLTDQYESSYNGASLDLEAPIPVAIEGIGYRTDEEADLIICQLDLVYFNHSSYVPAMYWKGMYGEPTLYMEEAAWYNKWLHEQYVDLDVTKSRFDLFSDSTKQKTGYPHYVLQKEYDPSTLLRTGVGRLSHIDKDKQNVRIYYPVSGQITQSVLQEPVFERFDLVSGDDSAVLSSFSCALRKGISFQPVQMGQYATIQYTGGDQSVYEMEFIVKGTRKLEVINRIKHQMDALAHTPRDQRLPNMYPIIHSELLNMIGGEYFVITDTVVKPIDQEFSVVKMGLLDVTPTRPTRLQLTPRTDWDVIASITHLRSSKADLIDLSYYIKRYIKDKIVGNVYDATDGVRVKFPSALTLASLYPANHMNGYLHEVAAAAPRQIGKMVSQFTKDTISVSPRSFYHTFLEAVTSIGVMYAILRATQELDQNFSEFFPAPDPDDKAKNKTQQFLQAVLTLCTSSANEIFEGGKELEKFVKYLKQTTANLLDRYSIKALENNVNNQFANGIVPREYVNKMTSNPRFIPFTTLQGVDPYPHLNLPVYSHIMGLTNEDMIEATSDPGALSLINRFLPSYRFMGELAPFGVNPDTFARTSDEIVEPDFWWFKWGSDGIPTPTEHGRSQAHAINKDSKLSEAAAAISDERQVDPEQEFRVSIKSISDGDTITVFFEDEVPQFIKDRFIFQEGLGSLREDVRSNFGDGYVIRLSDKRAPEAFLKTPYGSGVTRTPFRTTNENEKKSEALARKYIYKLLAELLQPGADDTTLDSLVFQGGTALGDRNTAVNLEFPLEGDSKLPVAYLSGILGNDKYGRILGIVRKDARKGGTPQPRGEDMEQSHGKGTLKENEAQSLASEFIDVIPEQYRMAFAFPAAQVQFIWEGSISRPLSADEELILKGGGPNSEFNDPAAANLIQSRNILTPFRANVFIDAPVAGIDIYQRSKKLKVANITLAGYADSYVNSRSYIFPQTEDLSSIATIQHATDVGAVPANTLEVIKDAASLFRHRNLVTPVDSRNDDGGNTISAAGRRILQLARESDTWMRNQLLRSGTRVVVRIGYTSSTTNLPVRFTGTIGEVTTGDSISLTCQSYDAQLLRHWPQTFKPDGENDVLAQILFNTFDELDAHGGTKYLGGFKNDPLGWLNLGYKEYERLSSLTFDGNLPARSAKAYASALDKLQPKNKSKEGLTEEQVNELNVEILGYFNETSAIGNEDLRLGQQAANLAYNNAVTELNSEVSNADSINNRLGRLIDPLNILSQDNLLLEDEYSNQTIDALDVIGRGISESYAESVKSLREWAGLEAKFHGELINCYIPVVSQYKQILNYFGRWIGNGITISGGGRTLHSMLDEVIKWYPGMVWYFDYFEDEMRLFIGYPDSRYVYKKSADFGAENKYLSTVNYVRGDKTIIETTTEKLLEEFWERWVKKKRILPARLGSKQVDNAYIAASIGQAYVELIKSTSVGGYSSTIPDVTEGNHGKVRSISLASVEDLNIDISSPDLNIGFSGEDYYRTYFAIENGIPESIIGALASRHKHLQDLRTRLLEIGGNEFTAVFIAKIFQRFANGDFSENILKKKVKTVRNGVATISEGFNFDTELNITVWDTDIIYLLGGSDGIVWETAPANVEEFQEAVSKLGAKWPRERSDEDEGAKEAKKRKSMVTKRLVLALPAIQYMLTEFAASIENDSTLRSLVAAKSQLKKLDDLIRTLRPPREKAFRRYIPVTSNTGILSNNMYASESHMYNQVRLSYEPDWASEENFKEFLGIGSSEINIGLSVSPDQVRQLQIESPHVNSEKLAVHAGRSWLAEGLATMYKGSILLRGMELKPYDVLTISDVYSNMFGPVEVAEVIESFNSQTGYTSLVMPKMLTTAHTINQVSFTNNSSHIGNMLAWAGIGLIAFGIAIVAAPFTGGGSLVWLAAGASAVVGAGLISVGSGINEFHRNYNPNYINPSSSLEQFSQRISENSMTVVGKFGNGALNTTRSATTDLDADPGDSDTRYQPQPLDINNLGVTVYPVVKRPPGQRAQPMVAGMKGVPPQSWTGINALGQIERWWDALQEDIVVGYDKLDTEREVRARLRGAAKAKAAQELAAIRRSIGG